MAQYSKFITCIFLGVNTALYIRPYVTGPSDAQMHVARRNIPPYDGNNPIHHTGNKLAELNAFAKKYNPAILITDAVDADPYAANYRMKRHNIIALHPGQILSQEEFEKKKLDEIASFEENDDEQIPERIFSKFDPVDKAFCENTDITKAHILRYISMINNKSIQKDDFANFCFSTIAFGSNFYTSSLRPLCGIITLWTAYIYYSNRRDVFKADEFAVKEGFGNALKLRNKYYYDKMYATDSKLTRFVLWSGFVPSNESRIQWIDNIMDTTFIKNSQ